MTPSCVLLPAILLSCGHHHLAKSLKLPDHQTSYENGKSLTCLTRSDADPCPPDTQIDTCKTNWTKVLCTPCQPGLRLCDNSTSALPAKCYDPADFCSRDGDNNVKVTDLPDGGCKIACVCNEENGYFGEDPSRCEHRDTTCSIFHSRQFNPHKYCMPCPDGYYNPRDDGIDVCVPQIPINNSSLMRPITKTVPVQQMTMSSTASPATSLIPESPPSKPDNGQIYNSMENIGGSSHGAVLQKDILVPIIICVILVLILVLIIMLYFCQKHTQNKDERHHPAGVINQFCMCVGGNNEPNVHVNTENDPHPAPNANDGLLGHKEEQPPERAATIDTVEYLTHGQTEDDDVEQPPNERGFNGHLSDDSLSGRRPHEHDERPNGILYQAQLCESDHLPKCTEEQGCRQHEVQGGPRAQGPGSWRIQGLDSHTQLAGQELDRPPNYRSRENSSQPPPYSSSMDNGELSAARNQRQCDSVTSDSFPGNTLTPTFISQSTVPISQTTSPDQTCVKQVETRPGAYEQRQAITEDHTRDSVEYSTYPSDALQAMPLSRSQGRENCDSPILRQQLTEPKRKLSCSSLSNGEIDICKLYEAVPFLPCDLDSDAEEDTRKKNYF